MQGNHKYKLRITYKKEVDRFQYEAVCADSFTYSFYFRNQPAPSDNTPCDISALHKRVMSLLIQMKGKNYACEMDNLYMSVKLEKLCKTSKSKTMISVVCCQKGRGISTCVEQQEDKTK